MNKIEVPDRSLIIDVASSWDELDQQQVIKILKLATKLSTGKYSVVWFKTQCLYVIARIQRNWISIAKERHLSKKTYAKKTENTYLIANELTSFLFIDPEAKKLEFSYNTIFNFFPVIKTYGRKFHGPDHLLSDLTFGEFRAAISAMSIYFSSKAEADLNDFIACLHRPAQKDMPKIKREPLNPDLQEIYANKIQSVAFHIKTGILLWFTSCIKHLQTQPIIVNGKEIDLSILFPKASADDKPSNGLGWTAILYGVAKDGVFGDIEKTDYSGLFDILLYMYDNHLQNEKLKAKR